MQTRSNFTGYVNFQQRISPQNQVDLFLLTGPAVKTVMGARNRRACNAWIELRNRFELGNSALRFALESHSSLDKPAGYKWVENLQLKVIKNVKSRQSFIINLVVTELRR